MPTFGSIGRKEGVVVHLSRQKSNTTVRRLLLVHPFGGRMRNSSPELAQQYQVALTKRAGLNGRLERVKSEIESLEERIKLIGNSDHPSDFTPDEELVKARDKKRHLENSRLDIVNDIGFVEADIRMCEYESSVCVDCED